MTDAAVEVAAPRLSYARGEPLAQEEGIGALTLGGYLREVTERFGPREAAVLREGDAAERWTYAELWERSVAVARALVACGIGRHEIVGLLMTNRLEFLSGLFGAALAGAVASPISTFSTPDELDEVVRLSGCSVLLVEGRVLKKDFAEILTGLEPRLATGAPGAIASTRYPFLRHVALVDGEGTRGAIEGWQAFLARGEAVDPAVVEARAAAVRPSDPGALFFSSGSTGRAKGILSAHRGVCLQLWRWRRWYAIGEPPRTWSANGFFFSGNFAMTLGSALSTGGTVVLQRWFDPAGALALVEAERVSMQIAWPHQWPQLEAAPGYADADLSSLRYVDVECPIGRHPTVTADWREPKQAYGCTETFTIASIFASGTPPAVIGSSHGRPTAGTTIKIVDPLTGATLPLGERGEIAVKGPTLMLGYVGVPLDETLDDEGFFRTNDGGALDADGRLFWDGRLNDIVKTGGANVSPLEIDRVLRDCPGVKGAFSVGVPDPLLGELIVACVVPLAGAAPDEEAVRGFARTRLASYKVPRRVLFFTEDELPTTGSAKVKTADLRKMAVARLGAEEPQPA